MKDRENQIEIKRGVGVMTELLNQEIEELQKAKAIEEMGKAMCEEFRSEHCGNDCECANEFIAKKLVEQGYRKINDSVVLSMEEYEKLTASRLFIKPRELNQKELSEKLKNEKYGIIGVDESSMEIIPTRQEIENETAEKILNELYCTPKEQVENKIKDLARFIGVKIKE